LVYSRGYRLYQGKWKATNMTLKSDVKYILDGWVYIKDGATLTIEPGTVIKGKTGTKASLMIE